MVTPRELRLRASDRHRPVVCEHRAEQFQQVRRAGGRMSPLPAPMCLLLLAALGCLWHGVSALQIKALQVPESIEAGEVVRLVCIFDPEQEDLYSVKWYKDDIEFFRFLPKDKPANQFFEIRDVEVDMSRSSNGTVFLKNTSRSAEGMYRCEVSADAPSFQSIFSEKFMAVEDRPEETPENAAHLLCPWSRRQILWTMLFLLVFCQ